MLRDHSRNADFVRFTGGSTAEPVQLPAWYTEIEETEPNEWLARSWFGIEPSDWSFRIWGHAHLLGRGLKGWCNARIREAKDRVLGILRISAYDLSDHALRRAADQLAAFPAAYILGYSSALDCFARVNRCRNYSETHQLKAVIATAEAFPFPDSARLIGNVFGGAPVVMEYGSVETGVLAHMTSEGHYQAFWLSYFIEAFEKGPAGGYRIRLTSLTPRCFPLIRYDLGDEISLQTPSYGVQRFNKVIGRSSGCINLEDGSVIHSEGIAHCLRDLPNILGYQVVVNGQELSLNIRAKKHLTKPELEQLRLRLGKVNPSLAEITITCVHALEQTISGKCPLIIRR